MSLGGVNVVSVVEQSLQTLRVAACDSEHAEPKTASNAVTAIKQALEDVELEELGVYQCYSPSLSPSPSPS